MSDGTVTYQGIKRITWLPERAANDNGTIIGGQEYTDVEFIGGSISNVTLTDVTVNGVTTARTERIVTADGDVTVASDDYVITMDKTSDEATTVLLPAVPTTSRSLIIKDGKGDANSYNITLDPGGYMIDGGSSYIIDSSYGAVEIIFNGIEWNVIGALTENSIGNTVVGPVSSTNNALAVWNGISGNTIKDSTASYDGTNLTLNGNVVYRAGGTDVPVADGGTGASTLTGYVKGSGTSPLTASATIPNTDITGLGTMSTQDANAVAITGGTIRVPNPQTGFMGIGLGDQLEDHYLNVLCDEDLTGNRSLALRTNNQSVALTITGNTAISGNSSGTNTGDQTITLTGDVTGSGTGTFAATIASAAVTRSKLATGAVGKDNVTASKTTTYAATTDDDFIPCNAASGAFTVTLYAASGNSGRRITLKKTDSTLNQVTIEGNGTETIDGALNKKLSTQYETITLECDGSNWYIDSRSGTVTPWVAYTPTFTGFGTASSVSMWSRRNGDQLEVRGKFTCGTNTSTEARMSLGFNGSDQPSGLTSDSTKVTSIQLAGPFAYNITAVATLNMLIESGVAYLTFGAQNASNAGLTKLNGNAVVTNNQPISILAAIPVTGWEA